MELNEIINYIQDNGSTFNYGDLDAKDYRTFFIMLNRIDTSLDTSSNAIRNLAMVMAEFTEAVQELRGDIERLVEKRYPQIPILPTLSFLTIIRDLAKTNLDDHQNCVSYLHNLLNACYASISSNPNMQEIELNVVKAIMFAALHTVKGFNRVIGGEDKSLEGVEIAFDKRKAR